MRITREKTMARPQKYKLSKIADFNRIATLAFNGFLTETEGAKLFDMNKVTFKNKMDEWVSETITLRFPGETGKADLHL